MMTLDFVEVFRFESFVHWVNTAQRMPWTMLDGETGAREVCFDTKGRLCRIGRDFMRARDEGAFPVVAYRVEPTDGDGSVRQLGWRWSTERQCWTPNKVEACAP